MNGSILVVDDDRHFARSLGRALSQDGHQVEVFDESASALAELERRPYDVLFSDLVMPGMDGLELMARVRVIRPDCRVVLLTGHPSFESARAALRRGACDYLTKPPSIDEEVRPLVRMLLGEPSHQRNGSAEDLPSFSGVADPDGPMGPLLDLLPRLAASRAPVLLSGETGTGKELFAEALHRLSDRGDGPFVQINCAALHEGTLEAELFGAVRGAYTGAEGTRRGVFEAADSGTLFLDEIAEASAAVQAKLLRVLQEGVFHRLGDPSKPISTTARIVAASHRNLEGEVRAGRFRLDLFHRLSVLPVTLPPLRERLDELRPLIDFCARGLGHTAPVEIEAAAMDALRRHTWPGNIRELRNAVEYGFVISGGGTLRLGDLPTSVSNPSPAPAPSDRGLRRVEPLRDTEVRQILDALRETGGNRSRAAALLGVTRRTLGYRIRKHGLEPDSSEPKPKKQLDLPGIQGDPGCAN